MKRFDLEKIGKEGKTLPKFEAVLGVFCGVNKTSKLDLRTPCNPLQAGTELGF